MDEREAIRSQGTVDPADRRVFALPAETWDEFVAQLDREAVERPRLRALLTEPSILELSSSATPLSDT